MAVSDHGRVLEDALGSSAAALLDRPDDPAGPLRSCADGGQPACRSFAG